MSALLVNNVANDMAVW